MDPLDFGSLAHIRILLVPVGSIKHATFTQWASEIRTFENIRLGDIPADSREERGLSFVIDLHGLANLYPVISKIHA